MLMMMLIIMMHNHPSTQHKHVELTDLGNYNLILLLLYSNKHQRAIIDSDIIVLWEFTMLQQQQQKQIHNVLAPNYSNELSGVN